MPRQRKIAGHLPVDDLERRHRTSRDAVACTRSQLAARRLGRGADPSQPEPIKEILRQDPAKRLQHTLHVLEACVAERGYYV